MSGVKDSVAPERLSPFFFLKAFSFFFFSFPAFCELSPRRPGFHNGGKAVAPPAIRARPRRAGTS
jgi:hypothetical protein